MTRIKICGLRRVEDTLVINEVMPEYAGLVFWDKSKRNLDFETAKNIRAALDDKIETVGVFVDRDVDDIVKLVNEGIISVVQLHGSEDDNTIEIIRRRTDNLATIIKAFEVKSEDDVKRANDSSADIVLIDSGKGSGNTFDWKLLREIERDYFLAGGLDSLNVAAAIKELNPYAVDVSSKVETDGYKDPEKIIEFCNAVRENIN